MATRHAEVRRTPNWSPLFAIAMASMFKRSCWCGTISGWPPAGSCRDWRSDLLEGENSALVDLFDPRHAKKVLTAFGRAYGALPEKRGDLRRDQENFWIKPISGLAQDGKIISVRLGLVRRDGQRKALDPGHLSEVGGTEGVGVDVPRRDIQCPAAPPKHRLHQKAAQAVLKALLPETGTDIKGQMRSRAGVARSIGICRTAPGTSTT